MNKSTLRLLGRAALAGLTAAALKFQASHGIDSTVLYGCVTAGVLAAGEVFTPLNAYIGLFTKFVPKD